jgi:phage shock protein PspC (stress-responsive transcriptional regulator)
MVRSSRRGASLQGPDSGKMTYMSDGNGTKTLYRTHESRIVAGVCSGMGQYFSVDANLIRVLFLVVTVFTGGALGVLAYLFMWIVVPEEGEKTSIAQDMINKAQKS